MTRPALQWFYLERLAYLVELHEDVTSISWGHRSGGSWVTRRSARFRTADASGCRGGAGDADGAEGGIGTRAVNSGPARTESRAAARIRGCPASCSLRS